MTGRIEKVIEHLRTTLWKDCNFKDNDEVLKYVESLIAENNKEIKQAAPKVFVIGVGKYHRSDIVDVPTGYLRWVLTTDKKITSPHEDDIIAKYLIEERKEDYRYLGDAGRRYNKAKRKY